MLDDPIIIFLCEERFKGNVGYLSTEFIINGLDRSRNGNLQKCLRGLVLRGFLNKAIELDLHRKYLYRVNDGVYGKWLKLQKK